MHKYKYNEPNIYTIKSHFVKKRTLSVSLFSRMA